MNRNKHKHTVGLMLFFTGIVFAAIAIGIVCTSMTLYLLVKVGLISVSGDTITHVPKLIFSMALISIPIGIILALIFSKIPFKPMRDLVAGMNQLASGDFKTRISVGPVMRKSPAFTKVAESFNKMAQELESTEMLRSDFVNNFSHEFKTPIVSIAGFAKLLNRGNLTQEQQKEYLRVIEEESMRLSYMATNVLNLTKVENQSILTDVAEYNLSEQIRSCVLLLENKWADKDLEFRLQFGEHQIRASEELLKQVWINLLDNAIKFTPDGQVIEVRISETEESCLVSVLNTGSEIPPEHQKKIFNKFYQADESHASQGNGVGLAIVKRIAQLHGGEVSVSSENMVTIFTVELPKG